MKNLAVFLMLAVAMTFASCGSDDGPVIEVVTPVSGNSFKQNTDVVFEIRLSDDEGLASVSLVSPMLGLSDTENLEGNTLATYTFKLSINDAPTDKYDIIITAIDTDGNTASEKVEIEVVE